MMDIPAYLHEFTDKKRLADMNIRAKIELFALARGGSGVQHNSRPCNTETERDDEQCPLAPQRVAPAGA